MIMQKIQELYQHFLASPKIVTDSRVKTDGSLFFALSGERFNGNHFAKAALENGAEMAIIDDPSFDEQSGKYFVVSDVLQALQNLALYHRESSKAMVIGITGSNGKTTTKELIARVLETEKEIVATQGNLNNHIGVPLTLLRITQKTQVAIVEMGANHPGEIATLCQLARPNIGIITNIGSAHLEGFGSFEGVKKTKNELYDFIRTNNGTAIVNSNDPLLMELSEGLHRITYGSDLSDVTGRLMEEKPCLKLEARTSPDNRLVISSQLYGEYNFPNILAAITLGKYFKIKNKHVIKAIESYTPDNSRSQLLKTETNQLVLDAYNANPVSMQMAITSFHRYGNANPWLILGDMFELGDVSTKEHEKIVNLVEQFGFSNAIFVGSHFAKVVSDEKYLHFDTTHQALQYLLKNPIRQAQILIKGSRGMLMEKLLPSF